LETTAAFSLIACAASVFPSSVPALDAKWLLIADMIDSPRPAHATGTILFSPDQRWLSTPFRIRHARPQSGKRG